MFTPTKITAMPNGDQWVAMSTVARPVTQIVETAVNSASARGVTVRSADAAGSDSSAVKTRMSAAKMTIAKRDGEEVVSSLRLRAIERAVNRERNAVVLPDIVRDPLEAFVRWPPSWYSGGSPTNLMS